MLEMITGAAVYAVGLVSGILINKYVGFKSTELKFAPPQKLEKVQPPTEMIDPIYATPEREKDLLEDIRATS